MAYEEGVAAYYDRWYLRDNPYYEGTEEYIMWRKGWLQALDDYEEMKEIQG